MCVCALECVGYDWIGCGICQEYVFHHQPKKSSRRLLHDLYTYYY